MLLYSEARVTAVSNEHHTHVSRLSCQLCGGGNHGQGSFDIDVHTGVFPVRRGSKLEIALATSGEVDEGLLETYDYVMRGQVTHVEKDSLYVSFSGLMMCARGFTHGAACKGGSSVCCYIRRSIV